MKVSDLISLLLLGADIVVSANIGRTQDIQKRQGWDILGSAVEALGALRSVSSSYMLEKQIVLEAN
jgi:hypothetical protein